MIIMGCLHGPPPPQGDQQLLEARQFMARGDYRRAVDISQRVLRQFPDSLADQALFQLGLIYAHPANPERNVQNAVEAFQHIIDRYPTSQLHPQAELWLVVLGNLRAQEEQIQDLKQRNVPLKKTVKIQRQKINQLREQLEKFKRIDIKMEEKKRTTIPRAEDVEEKRNGKNSGS
jgi:tetratricopeptide (TPR) repeat protein